MTDPFIPERPIICPYDSNHSIVASRIQKHLVKCARNFPPDYKVSCPYNATHRLFKFEIEDHIFKCPDHQHFDPIIYEQFQKRGAIMPTVASDSHNEVDCQESWDDEDESRFYTLPSPANCPSGRPLNPVRKWSFNNNGPRNNPILMGDTTRAPSGLAEALMIERSGESTVEDIESVTSFMGVGRGKPWNEPRHEIVRKIGRGRGSGHPQAEI